jgi:hypothetical protein
VPRIEAILTAIFKIEKTEMGKLSFLILRARQFVGGERFAEGGKEG